MGLAATTQSSQPGVVPRIVDCYLRHGWLQALCITSASFVAFTMLMKLSLVLLFGNGIAVLWPMVGMTAAVMLRLPRRRWPLVVTGVAMGHIYLERRYAASQMLVDTICDVIEVLIVSYSLPAFKNLRDWMRQPNLLLRFITLAMTAGPLGTSIPVGLVFSRVLHQPFWIQARQWGFADALGIVLWLPLATVMLSPETYALFQWRALPRTLGLIGMLATVCLVIFEHSLPVAFVVMPILLVVALKLGFSGSVLAVNILSLLTAVSTLHGHGPFMLVTPEYRVMALQLFLAVCMLMCFPISMILLDRDAFERELREAYERMEQLAINDALTGLANRRQFDSALSKEWRRAIRGGEALGLMMIDADCFKLYNDCYGHVAGDDCLRRIAETLAREVQRPGDLVGRYGGEEFFVLMPGAETAGLLKVAESIRRQVEAMKLDHKENLFRVVTVSIGCCSVIPTMRGRPEALVEAADQALYAAKQKGRNRVEAFEPVELEQAAAILVAPM